jgi:hypothetical protein
MRDGRRLLFQVRLDGAAAQLRASGDLVGVVTLVEQLAVDEEQVVTRK